MTTFNVLTILVGLATIGVNIWIARYNAGKNRKIYEIETHFVGEGKDEVINKILSNGNYTILHLGQDLSNTRQFKYVLGKVS